MSYGTDIGTQAPNIDRQACTFAGEAMGHGVPAVDC